MKKVLLLLAIFGNSLIHATEKPSWYKTPAFIASTTAAVGSILTVVSWRAWSNYKSQLNNAKEQHKNDPTVASQEKLIDEADRLNEDLKDDHTNRNDGVYISPNKVVALEAAIKKVDADGIAATTGYREFYSAETQRMHWQHCSECKPNGVKRAKPCSAFESSYYGTKGLLQSKKLALHAPHTKAKKDYSNKIWWARTACYTGAAATCFALGYTCAAKK